MPPSDHILNQLLHVIYRFHSVSIEINGCWVIHYGSEMLPDGSTTTLVYTGDAEKPLLTATGVPFHYTGIAPHYALFRSGLVAVEYA